MTDPNRGYQSDWYKGDGGLTDILAFTIAEWAELQRQLQVVHTLMNVYAYTYRGVKLEVNSPHGYWPARQLRSRRWLTTFTADIRLNADAWFDRKEIIWQWAETGSESFTFLYNRFYKLEPAVTLSSEQLQDFDLISDLIGKARVIQGRKVRTGPAGSV